MLLPGTPAALWGAAGILARALMDEFEEWSRAGTTEEVLVALAKQNVPAAAYRTVREAMADPQLDHRNALAVVNDGGGTFKALNPPFRMTDSRTEAGAHAAALGEHTNEVLKAAGFTAEEIKSMSGQK